MSPQSQKQTACNTIFRHFFVSQFIGIPLTISPFWLLLPILLTKFRESFSSQLPVAISRCHFLSTFSVIISRRRSSLPFLVAISTFSCLSTFLHSHSPSPFRVAISARHFQLPFTVAISFHQLSSLVPVAFFHFHSCCHFSSPFIVPTSRRHYLSPCLHCNVLMPLSL